MPVKYQKEGADGRYARRRLLVLHVSSSRRRAVAAQRERSHFTAASSVAASATTGHVPGFPIGPTYASHIATGRKQRLANTAVAILRQTFHGSLAQASAPVPVARRGVQLLTSRARAGARQSAAHTRG